MPKDCVVFDLDLWAYVVEELKASDFNHIYLAVRSRDDEILVPLNEWTPKLVLMNMSEPSQVCAYFEGRRSSVSRVPALIRNLAGLDSDELVVVTNDDRDFKFMEIYSGYKSVTRQSVETDSSSDDSRSVQSGDSD